MLDPQLTPHSFTVLPVLGELNHTCENISCQASVPLGTRPHWIIRLNYTDASDRVHKESSPFFIRDTEYPCSTCGQNLGTPLLFGSESDGLVYAQSLVARMKRGGGFMKIAITKINGVYIELGNKEKN
jgi:hypothetical protein